MERNEIAEADKTHLLPTGGGAPSGYAYEAALSAAGVTVEGFEQFGSYQGDWWARVRFPNDEVYYVNGSYGSCSGCDAFEAEFGWSDDEKPDYHERLAAFGRDYLTLCYTQEQAIAEASKNTEWDSEAPKVIAWLSTPTAQE